LNFYTKDTTIIPIKMIVEKIIDEMLVIVEIFHNFVDVKGRNI